MVEWLRKSTYPDLSIGVIKWPPPKSNVQVVLEMVSGACDYVLNTLVDVPLQHIIRYLEKEMQLKEKKNM